MDILYRNFFEILKKTLTTICFVLLSSPIFAQSNPNDNWIKVITKEPGLKLIWTFDIGFFMALSALCALGYLFFMKNRVVFWYMWLMILLTLVYSAILTPYYFNNRFVAFSFYFTIKLVQSGALICAIKILQDLTQLGNPTKFKRLLVLSFVGLLCCLIGYFYLPLYDALNAFYYITCIVLLFQCILTIWQGVRQKKLNKNFIILYSIISVLFVIQSFPITDSNDSSISALRIWVNILLPFSIACFLALVFAKYSKSFFKNEAEMKTLELEKQLILEKQNETLARQVSEQTAELQVLNNTKDKLFSIISHDLRSPMASLKGTLQLFEYNQFTQKEFQESVQHLQKNVDSVHTMLENVLQWSLSQMTGFKPSIKEFDFNEIINETVEIFREIATKKQIELRCNMEKNLVVLADDNHVRTILRNIIGNAIKFTPKKGLVNISAKTQNSRIEIEICDSGIGIKKEDLATIFSNPKLKAGTAGEGSTGLGLILCRELIEQNSGEISVMNNNEGGTTFKIVLNVGFQDLTKFIDMRQVVSA